MSNTQWYRIEGFLTGRQSWVGVTAKDNRNFVNGVLWVLRSGAQWKDLPAQFGNWKSVHKRFTRWAGSGVRQRIFQGLLDDPDNRCVMIDSTIVRAHLLSLSKGVGLWQRGPKRCSGQLPRWTEHQDTHGVRRPGPADAIRSYRRAGSVWPSGDTPAEWNRGRCGAGGQGI